MRIHHKAQHRFLDLYSPTCLFLKLNKPYVLYHSAPIMGYTLFAYDSYSAVVKHQTCDVQLFTSRGLF